MTSEWPPPRKITHGQKVRLAPPSLACPECGFTHHLRGQWTFGYSLAVDGRSRGPIDAVLWVGKGPEMTESRGPEFDGCSECGASFHGVECE